MTMFSPEFQLAAACAIWPPSHHRNESIRTAAAARLDWPRFLRVARRHQLVGLVHDGLMRARPDAPQEIVEEFGAHALALARENLAMARESWRLQRLFDDANLPILFVKGAPLAVLAFGSLSLRSSQDIDLLTDYKSLPAAIELILHAGYRRVDPPQELPEARLRLLMSLRKDLIFVHENTGIRLEVHWRLFLNQYALVESSITSSSQVVRLTGTVGLRTLGDEDLFAYLCMHGALHCWNRLKWVADINAICLLNGGIDDLVEAATARGAGRAAAQGLLLSRRLLATPLSDRLMSVLTKRATVRWLEATAHSALTAGQDELDPHQLRFGTTRGSLSTFLLSRNWRYRLAELKIHLISSTDMLSLPLPKALRFLYPFLRLPLWVVRHSAKPSHVDERRCL